VPAIEIKSTTVDLYTVDKNDRSLAVGALKGEQAASLPPISLWLTESGEIVPASRVKRIRLAQDVLSPAEESVYDTLWGVKSAGATKEERENYRIVQAGYDFLIKRTRLSKKTIQRIIDRLLDKGFISIERPADIYQRSSTVYRVFAYRAVLDRQAQKGRFHVAKIGPGFVYVREVADPRSQGGLNLSTVVKTVPSTAGGFDPSTEPTFVAPTEDGEDLTTVATEATRFRQRREDSPPSSSEPGPSVSKTIVSGQDVETREVRELRGQLERYLGFIDDDATRQLLRQCRVRAADCRLEEIAYFVSHKMRTVNGIHNPVGFILTAVPRHFENQGHSSVRAFLAEEAARRERIWQEEYRYWGSIAEDSDAPAEERARAEEILHSLKRERKPQE
jgi:predicted transcriptional regulator